MAGSIVRTLDRLFPPELATAELPSYRIHKVEFSALHLKHATSLVVVTFAIFGIWDVFGGNGGIVTTRFRYLVACPLTAVFAFASHLSVAKRYQEIFVMFFSVVTILLVSVTLILINSELPFKISTGNATINFYLVVFFGYSLLPYFVIDGLIVGMMVITAHIWLICYYSNVDLVVKSFYIFHILCAVMIGMVVAYWREWHVRTDFHNKRKLAEAGVAKTLYAGRARIIVSYRRADSDAITGRIRDRLAAHFGESSIFMDIDSIPIGTDFREHIRAALTTADVLIVVIGPKWLFGSTEGSRRVNEETDPVRVEVEAAIQNKIPIIPVVVGGAKMPAQDELPESIRELSFRNAACVDTGVDFHQHVDRLIRSIERILPGGVNPIGREDVSLRQVSLRAL